MHILGSREDELDWAIQGGKRKTTEGKEDSSVQYLN